MTYNMDPAKGGIKDDADKPRMELIPPETLIGLAKVLTEGASKYDDWNWAQGMSWLRVYGSLQRHLVAWLAGEELDPESGLSHLSHALANVAFLHYYQARRVGTDDRRR